MCWNDVIADAIGRRFGINIGDVSGRRGAIGDEIKSVDAGTIGATKSDSNNHWAIQERPYLVLTIYRHSKFRFTNTMNYISLR